LFSAIGELRRLNIRTFSGLDSKNCKEAWHPDVINLKREQKGRKYDRLHCEIVRGKWCLKIIQSQHSLEESRTQNSLQPYLFLFSNFIKFMMWEFSLLSVLVLQIFTCFRGIPATTFLILDLILQMQ